MFKLPKDNSQKGAASLIIVSLLLAGITAAVYLTQTGTSFLPNAAEDQYYERVKAAVDKLPNDAAAYIILPNNQTITKNPNTQLPSFSVIKLWIAASAFKENLYESNKSLVDNMLIHSDNDAANSLIDKMTFGNINEHIRNNDLSSGGFSNTYLGRYMLKTSTRDNLTSAADAVKFMKDLNENKIVSNGASQKIRDILHRRSSEIRGKTSKDPFTEHIPQQILDAGFISKSGILNEGRNDVGLFKNSNRDLVYFAILLPSGGDDSKKKLTEILNALYNAGSNPQSAPAADPVTQTNNPSTKVNVTECTNQTHKDYCKKSNLTCFLINGDAKCAFPTSATTCNSDDTTFCSTKGGCSFQDITIVKPDKTEEAVKISKCNNNSTAPGAAGTTARPVTTQPAAGAPAAAPAATQPQSSTCSAIQDPWDIDKKGDSGKVKYVLEESAKASGAAASTQSTPNSAADHAKQAYINAFNSAYESSGAGKGFGFSISQAKKARSANGSETYCADNSATLARDAEANNTAIHAYVLTKSPGIDWNTAKSNGLVQEAISALRLTGVTPSSISTPGSQPTKRTIDASTAVDCGSDLDGTQIPCYKMGVFENVDELKATEAEASIATKRYVKSQEIINEAKGKVNEAILTAAQKKLDDAKAKAAACMPK